VTFTIFYGAAANQTEAMAALGAVSAEAYSLGKPDPVSAGANDGSPNTYIFGFAGVGGTPIAPGASGPAAVPMDAPLALGGTAALMGALGALALRRRRRRAG
jgi:hypothetical protein